MTGTMQRHPLGAGLAFLLLASTGSATRAETYEQGQQSAGGVDPALNACDAREQAASNDALNQIYGQVLAAIPDGRKSPLRLAERNWIGFRDAECSFRQSAETGGTDAIQIHDRCMIELTRQRTDQLAAALKQAKF